MALKVLSSFRTNPCIFSLFVSKAYLFRSAALRSPVNHVGTGCRCNLEHTLRYFYMETGARCLKTNLFLRVVFKKQRANDMLNFFMQDRNCISV